MRGETERLAREAARLRRRLASPWRVVLAALFWAAVGFALALALALAWASPR